MSIMTHPTDKPRPLPVPLKLDSPDYCAQVITWAWNAALTFTLERPSSESFDPDGWLLIPTADELMIEWDAWMRRDFAPNLVETDVARTLIKVAFYRLNEAMAMAEGWGDFPELTTFAEVRELVAA
jgi:hypothetical protein